jgi:hypothetical protein
VRRVNALFNAPSKLADLATLAVELLFIFDAPLALVDILETRPALSRLDVDLRRMP